MSRQDERTFLQRRHPESNGHMKRHSPSVIIRELQSKTAMSYHLTPGRMAKINNTGNNRCWQGCGEIGTLLHYLWECKLMQPCWKTVWGFPRKLKMELPYNLVLTVLGIYLKNTETLIHRDTTCTLCLLQHYLQ